MQIRFSHNVWIWSGGKASWYFVSLPKESADEIRFFTKHLRRGWGSVRVSATIGQSAWKTSIFPDKENDTFLLPLKKDIRVKESIVEGKIVDVLIEISI